MAFYISVILKNPWKITFYFGEYLALSIWLVTPFVGKTIIRNQNKFQKLSRMNQKVLEGSKTFYNITKGPRKV